MPIIAVMLIILLIHIMLIILLITMIPIIFLIQFIASYSVVDVKVLKLPFLHQVVRNIRNG